jgi:predicted GIY-YIG superfamily endonuclease
MSFWLSMLRCADGSFYVGHTDDLERRLAQHHEGANPNAFTASRRPLRLVYTAEMPTREDAILREMQVKNWSRAKKEALIRNDWEAISALARGGRGRARLSSTELGQNGGGVRLSSTELGQNGGAPVLEGLG